MKPNLFILGAARCGTTSLHSILGQHPDIHASAVKEPTFFCTSFKVVDDEQAYYALFDTEKRFRMEASHAYMTDPAIAQILKDLFPDATFIVTLREPKARAYSLFRHMRRHRHVDGEPFELVAEFAKALREEQERYASPAFHAACRHYPWNFLYTRSSMYDEQLARYLSLFPRDRFHFLTLAELAADPGAVTNAILRFLDLDTKPLSRLRFEHAREEEYGPCDDESTELMSIALAGVIERTERLVNLQLNWSR